MNAINTAILGYGSGGRIYNAPVIASVPGFSIRSIMTSSKGNRDAAKNDFPEARILSDFSEILEDPDIELLIITLPNHLHYQYAKEALLAGKNVVVEKPFTVKTEEADELIQLATANNLVLSVHHNRRWDSDILTIQQLLEQDRLGKLMEFEAHFDRFRNYVKDSWKEEEIPGSGILYDLGSHLIDQALMLFGEPREIFANLHIQREDSKVTDNFELLLFYPQLKVTLKAGMLVKEPGPRYKLFGRKGNYTKYGMDVQEEALKKGITPQDLSHWGKEPEGLWGLLNTEEEYRKIESLAGDYRRFYINVRDHIWSGTPLAVTAPEARNVIKVIELAQQSHDQKRILSFNR